MMIDHQQGMGLPDPVRPSPFLTTGMFAAEAGAGAAGYYFKKKFEKSSPHLLRARSKLHKLNSVYDDVFNTVGPMGPHQWAAGVPRKDPTPFVKARRKLLQKESILSKRTAFAGKYGKSLTSASKLLGGLSLFALAVEGGSALFDATTSYTEARRARQESTAGAGDVSYYDSRVAFTQRQRALQVIHNSQLSTRAAFGQEASYMHY